MVRIKYTTDAAAKAGRLRASQAEARQKSDKDTVIALNIRPIESC